MIIAAYSGTGKSTFAARIQNAADVVSMPWHRILPPKGSEEENESGKGRMDVFTDPLYPDNYIIEILKAEREHDYTLIPTDMEVVRRLREEYGRKIVLCYPADELKEEYKERFIARAMGRIFSITLSRDGMIFLCLCGSMRKRYISSWGQASTWRT